MSATLTHELKRVWPTSRGNHVAECRCGWQSPIMFTSLTARRAHEEHVEAEVLSMPNFDGETFVAGRDKLRLGKQAQAVWDVLRDGEWHTLGELHARTGYPEASISARIRDLRKAKFGGREVERDYLDAGLWRYRLVVGE